MSLIVLPRTTDATAVAEAQAKLKVTIEDPMTVVMLVYGEGDGVDRVLEVCTARASVKSAIRRVVWIPNPDVLSTKQKKLYWRDGNVAVAIGLDDKVAAELTLTRAKGRLFVDKAFLKAEGQ